MHVNVIHIDNDADHAEAMSLISRRMQTTDPTELAQLKSSIDSDPRIRESQMAARTSV
jgi:hypothetical protein